MLGLVGSDAPWGEAPGAVRAGVLASWERCRARRLSVDGTALPYDPEFVQEERLLVASLPVLDRLHRQLLGSRVSVLLTDGRARVVERRAGEPDLNRHLDAVQLAPGFGWADHEAGTNGIGTVLAEGRAAVILGSEHFSEAHRAFACAGAPIRDPFTGTIRGVVDLTSRRRDAHPLMAALAREAALAVEQRLLEQYSLGERALHDRALRSLGAVGAVGAGRGVHGHRRRRTSSPGWTAPVQHTLGSGGQGPGDAGGNSTAERAPELSGRAPVDPLPGRASLGPPPGSDQHIPAYHPVDQHPFAHGDAAGRVALAARDRLALLWEAGVRIGTTLDVAQTADELADVALPHFAQYATVDLAEWVPDGAEPPAGDAPAPIRRSATRTLRPGGALVPVGAPVGYQAGSAQGRALVGGRAVLDEEPERMVRSEPGLEQYRMGSVIAVPLSARGTVLGVASFYRSLDAGPFRADDLTLAEELGHRAAVCLDNARRYTREHALALTLQRSLLPRALPDLPAIEVAHRYLPAQEGVGGDWFDVIPLSGARVALVVGDVVGHGIHAAATMGRLRTAVRNFSALDLPPEELLGHLDALVDAMDQEEGELGGIGIIGATCLYVIYDPVTHHCTLASAGHPSPALLLPDGSVGFPEVPPGPPLGLGSTPFEAVEFDLPEGSEIVLYTDGLIEDRGQDIDVGLARLAEALAAARPGRDRRPEALCRAVVSALLPQRPRDDVALLIARTRGVSEAMVARWPVPMDPAAVSRLRTQVVARLDVWGLGELAGTVELLVSELVTNAIRHASGPVELRLLRDRSLICEVADGSSVSPRMRRARTEDEGGRGLFLVAQLAERWGTRFTSGGKVIWAELTTRKRFAALAAPRREAAG
ncbi:SpoIIE family protein phosphatase [Streptacidiphilus jiangxiensis]|uniref:SpoIIE family protein phosphatase n=1 Tax=Streptacidiphilus jiangxiensis TaxID=235985 RepID=UPI0005A898B9|nr:SpoIIE family protein phosphatase [Streptacidiphilus jiangxiensis]